MQGAISLTKLVKGLGKSGADPARLVDDCSGWHRIIDPDGFCRAKVAPETASSRLLPRKLMRSGRHCMDSNRESQAFRKQSLDRKGLLALMGFKVRS